MHRWRASTTVSPRGCCCPVFRVPVFSVPVFSQQDPPQPVVERIHDHLAPEPTPYFAPSQQQQRCHSIVFKGGSEPFLPTTTPPLVGLLCTAAYLWPSATAAATLKEAAAETAARPTFEPRLDPGVLVPQLLVLALTAGSALYWWLVVVPSARASLAKDKRTGETRQYLSELEADPSRRAERWFYSDWLQQLRRRRLLNAWNSDPSAKGDGTALGTGTANKPAGVKGSVQNGQEGPAGGMGEESGVTVDCTPEQDLMKPSYNTPNPRFWSLDNPLVITGLLLGLGFAGAITLHEMS